MSVPAEQFLAADWERSYSLLIPCLSRDGSWPAGCDYARHVGVFDLDADLEPAAAGREPLVDGDEAVVFENEGAAKRALFARLQQQLEAPEKALLACPGFRRRLDLVERFSRRLESGGIEHEAFFSAVEAFGCW